MSKAVADALYSMPEYTAFSEVEFAIESGGTVVLVGDSANKRLKSGACGVVQGIEGVTDCINNLIQLPVNAPDIRTREGVYASIYEKYLPNYSAFRPGERPMGGNVYMGPHPIHIIVDSGQVSLVGYVYSAEDKGSATHAAQVVPGVAKVENLLKVVPRPSGN